MTISYEKYKELLVKSMNLALELNLAGDPLDGEACRLVFKTATSIAVSMTDAYGTDALFGSDDVLAATADPDTALEVLEDHFGTQRWKY